MDGLDRYVEELRRYKVEDVPDFSANDGRTEAQILFLFQDPGNSGAAKTGVADRDNPDTSAKNFREANESADLDRKLTISWNAVPWPIGKSTPARELEIVRQEEWLDRLLELLPQLRVVALMGGVAHRLTPDFYNKRRDLYVLHGPHPSWRGVSTPERRRWLDNVILKARDLVV